MAESSSSVVPGDVEWLPGPGGTRLLRIHPPSPEPPVLILRDAAGEETRIDAVPGPHTEYQLPGDLDWDTAWLAWPDGSRATISSVARDSPAAVVSSPTVNAGQRASRPSPDSPAAHASPAPGDSSAAHESPAAGDAPAAHDAPAGRVSPVAPDAPAAEPQPIPRGFVRVPETVSRAEGPAGPSWITPPQLAAGPLVEGDWQERQEEVERELAQASAAIARAREGERVARDAVLTALTAARADLRAVRAAREADASAFAALSGELEAERSAHAVTRGSIGTLADALAAARADLTGAREATELAKQAGHEARATVAGARREAALARAEAASLRSALEAERAARASVESELRALNDRAGLLQRVADLDRDTAGLRDQVELERRAREQAEAAAAAARRPPEEANRLLADLDAAAAALRAAAPAQADATMPDVAASPDDATPAPTDTTPPAAAASRGDAAPAPTDATTPAADTPAQTDTPTSADATSPGVATTAPTEATTPAATSPGDATTTPADATPSTALVRADADLRLRKALLALSHEDASAAGALLVGLLPAQGAILDGSLSYDVTVRGIGTFGVFVEDGSARVVRLSRKRPRAQALFHLAGDPQTLAELLTGERSKLTRFRRKGRVSGRRKRAQQELAPLPQARLSLADAVKAGARLEPGLIYRALPFAIEPEWTKGHAFTVAQQIVELAPQSWHVTARDGLPLRVVEHAIDTPADATVTMSRAGFERLLKGEPHPLGDRPQVKGDHEAVAALKRWTDLARDA